MNTRVSTKRAHIISTILFPTVWNTDLSFCIPLSERSDIDCKTLVRCIVCFYVCIHPVSTIWDILIHSMHKSERYVSKNVKKTKFVSYFTWKKDFNSYVLKTKSVHVQFKIFVFASMRIIITLKILSLHNLRRQTIYPKSINKHFGCSDNAFLIQWCS